MKPCFCTVTLAPGAFCSSCGAVGAPAPTSAPHPLQFGFAAPLMNEHRIREIVREELERMAKK